MINGRLVIVTKQGDENFNKFAIIYDSYAVEDDPYLRNPAYHFEYVLKFIGKREDYTNQYLRHDFEVIDEDSIYKIRGKKLFKMVEEPVDLKELRKNYGKKKKA